VPELLQREVLCSVRTRARASLPEAETAPRLRQCHGRVMGKKRGLRCAAGVQLVLPAQLYVFSEAVHANRLTHKQ
jgi:hypothetical protein